MHPSNPSPHASAAAIVWPLPARLIEIYRFADGLRLRAPFMAGDEFRHALRNLQEQHSEMRVRLSRTISGDVALIYASNDLLERLHAAITAAPESVSASADTDEVE